MARFRKIATMSAILLGFAASGNAAAQSVGQAAPKEDKLLHGSAGQGASQAGSERISAEAQARAAEAAAQLSGAGPTSSSPSATYRLAAAGDDFAIIKVPTYVLPNGVAIQVSGDFLPGEDVTCISLCPRRAAQ